MLINSIINQWLFIHFSARELVSVRPRKSMSLLLLSALHGVKISNQLYGYQNWVFQRSLRKSLNFRRDLTPNFFKNLPKSTFMYEFFWLRCNEKHRHLFYPENRTLLYHWIINIWSIRTDLITSVDVLQTIKNISNIIISSAVFSPFGLHI